MDNITRDGLLNSAENESTYFLEFNSRCNTYGTSCVYIFVENYDLCFYPHRIEDILDRPVVGIPCDGKQNVLEVFSLISSKPEYNKYCLRYFVDADFDNNTTIDRHVYVTQCYSIENLFMDESVISKILENEYKIRVNEPNGKHEKCLLLFKKELSDFHNAVLLFNAWYREVKKKGVTKDMVNLQESLPTDYVDLTIGAICQRYTIEIIEETFPNAPKLSDDELNNSLLFLSNQMTALRGKYEFQFLDKFFEFLNIDAKGQRQYTVYKKGVNIDRKRILSMFEKYVRTPLDLRHYIVSGLRIVA